MEHKKQGSRNIVLVGLLAASVVLAGGLLYSRLNTAGDATSSGQQVAQITEDQWYRVQISGVEEWVYYAKVSIIDANTTRLSSVFYSPQNSDDSSTLIKLGAELRSPEDAMYVRTDKIAGIELLDTSTPQQDAITAYGDLDTPNDEWPSGSIDSYIKQGAVQAVFMSDGAVYYGDLLSTVSSIEMTGNRYRLVDDKDVATLIVADPADYQKYELKDVLYWQNLQPEGQISTAVADFN